MSGIAALPHDELAAELGGIAGRLERELRLLVSAAVAELREAIATARAERLEWRAELDDVLAAWEMRIEQRLDTLRDGVDGEPGPRGVRGTHIHSGSGAPEVADAMEGDIYLDVDTGDIHKFIS